MPKDKDSNIVWSCREEGQWICKSCSAFQEKAQRSLEIVMEPEVWNDG